MVHEIQPYDKRTDGRTNSGVLVIGSRFNLWVWNPNNQQMNVFLNVLNENIETYSIEIET